jgi:putative heme iron utilization protein
MADAITPEISKRICTHMNDDHAEAVLMYAKVFGQAAEATSASMDSIDPEGMNLIAQVNGNTTNLRITFDHTLTDSEDAHQTLIAMVRQTRQKG